MKVSIIIPCYNSARYLPACMESVLAQTMPDFEVILIDDGSSDDTLSIAGSIAQRDARVRVLHQKNSGVSAARNLGLDHASGEWITFVDSDDLLPPDALQTLLSGAKDGVDMIVCAHETFDEHGHTQVFIPESRWMDKTGETKRRAVCMRLIEGDSVRNIMCNKLHRRSMIERQHLRLTPGIRIAEDALFNLEAALCARDIVYINRIAYRYRTHSASAMHTQAAGELTRHAPWLCAMRDMLLRRGVMEAYYAAYLDSVVLRLYKDGGIPGVMRRFAEEAVPLLPDEKLSGAKLPVSAKMLRALVRSGAYPAAYPAICAGQIVCRKMSAAAFALRAKREMPI